jgi:hypothetical protein
MGRSIVILPWSHKGKVWKGFCAFIKPEWVLHADNGELSKLADQQLGEAINTSCVPASDGCHVHDLPVNQFNPIVFSKDAGVEHLIKVGDSERMPFNLDKPLNSRWHGAHGVFPHRCRT